MEATQVLLNAQSVDSIVRKHAEETLKQFQAQNLPGFLLSLSGELASEEKPVDSRKLAGLILKNALDAKEQQRKYELVQRWISLDVAVKTQIKTCLLHTLSSPVPDARSTASQVIAKVAGIELPQKQWPELIGSLLSNHPLSAAHVKQATLETLGYLCEEVSPDFVEQNQVNKILTAVIHGMIAEERNNDVRLAATRALYNALGFAQVNFAIDEERDFIMRVVCQTTLSPEVKIRQAAFECLVSISSTYYMTLAPYIQDIFSLTAMAIREDEEPVALQAIEFWSSICDEEIDILEDMRGDFNADSLPCCYFIKQALPALVPMLLETLLEQDEDQDQDQDEVAWNLAMAGGTCLGLVARTVGDDIVPLVMPFIEENITKPDWRQREAATYAFGSILEGPLPDKLTPIVNAALNFILTALTKDDNSNVKETTAWTLGRIFEFLHGSTVKMPINITSENCEQIITVLLHSLKDAPNVAEKACGALYFLAQGYGDVANASSPLTPFFQEMAQSLLNAARREDAGESRLRTAAYEALNEVVRCSTDETTPLVFELVPVIMMKLYLTLEASSDEREKQNELQGLLCGCLQVIIQKLGASEPTKHAFSKFADQIMSLFLRVFACRNATVHEEAMLSIGALAYAIGPDFIKYMPEFYKYLEMGLQNFEEYQVCVVTVGVVGDLFRALEDKMLPYCDGIMTHLLNDLSSNHLHRSVKPPIFSCLGDIALVIGQNFDKYLTCVMPMLLQSAAKIPARASGADDEINLLRNGILEAYSGIFQGFKNSAKTTQLLIPYADHILQFLDRIYIESDMDDRVIKTAIGVVGDLADTLGSNAASLIQQSVSCKDFLIECLSSDDHLIKESAKWAHMAINRAISGNFLAS